jgi:hypothetical protein
MRTLRGGCHCGDIVYHLSWPEAGELPVRRCGCSFCTRHNALYVSHPQAALAVTVADRGRLTRYRFGTRTADFRFCATCGVFVLVTSLIDDRLFAVVNAATLDDAPVLLAAPAAAAPNNFDGESLAEKLARRQRRWIGAVTIDERAAAF